MVNVIPEKYASEESYSLRLGDNFVSDALIAKLAVGVQNAAVHAAQDGDPAKAAKVVGMALQLVSSDDKNHNSHMHWRTMGELGTTTASGGTSAATDSGGTSNSEAVAPIETSAAQPSSAPPEEPGTDHVDEEAPRAEVRRVLVELFNVSRNEMVSLRVLRQRIQSQISTEEIIAVLKELEGDEYIMYRDEEGALDGPA
eukprot:scaffold104374_cov40-Phaeocystis_antarctica.AAC.1